MNKIKDEILTIVQRYACTPYHPDFVAHYKFIEIQLMINIDFWGRCPGSSIKRNLY